MLQLSFKQTNSELMVRAASTVLFNGLQRPHSVPLVAIGDLCEHPQYGFTASAALEPIGPKFVRITDLQDGKIDWASVPFCRCEEPKKFALYENDLLFARTGATTGKTYLVRAPQPAVFASYLIRLRPKPNVEVGYLYSFFQSDNYWSQISEEKEGSAQPNVNAEKLVALKIPFVHPDLQRAIASFVDCVRRRQDGSLVDLPELPAPLADLKHTVARIEELAAQVQGAQGLRMQAEEEAQAFFDSSLGRFFTGAATRFGIRMLNDFATVKGGKRLPAGERLSDEPTPHPYIRGSDMKKHSVNTSGLKYVLERLFPPISRYIINSCDVYVTIAGTIGYPGTVPKELDGANLTENAARLVFNTGTELSKEYVCYMLRSPQVQDHFLAKQTRAAQPKLALHRIGSTQIPFPPPSQQRQIVAHLDSLQEKTDALRVLQAETSAELDALMPAILDKAFRGEF
jgi:type I restriction enzyme S subunit